MTEEDSIIVPIRSFDKEDARQGQEAEKQVAQDGDSDDADEDALKGFAMRVQEEWNHRLEQNSLDIETSSSGMFQRLKYRFIYNSKPLEKWVLTVVLVFLTKAFAIFLPHPALLVVWSVGSGLCVVAVLSTAIAKRAHESNAKCFNLEKLRPPAGDSVASVNIRKRYLRYHIALLAALIGFGACSVVPFKETSLALAFIVLFGLCGIIVASLIGVGAWSPILGPDSFIVVESLYDIAVAVASLLSEETNAVTYLSVSIVLAVLAITVTLWRKAMDSENTTLIFVAFALTDASDVVLLASQLLLEEKCTPDPKVVVIGLLLALNPCISEASAAFKGPAEIRLEREVQLLQRFANRNKTEFQRNKTELQKKLETLRKERGRRQRMADKSVQQSIVTGLVVFSLVYVYAFSTSPRERNWHLLLLPVLLGAFYCVDSWCFDFFWSRRFLNEYFYGMLFRMTAACWILILAFTTGLFANTIGCSDATALTIWAAYLLVPMLLKTVLSAVQFEPLLLSLGELDKRERLMPKLLRPAQADLASYYARYIERPSTSQQDKSAYAGRVFALFKWAMNTNGNDVVVIAALLDVLGYVIEIDEQSLSMDQLPDPGIVVRFLIAHYLLPVQDESKHYAIFRERLETIVLKISLTKDVDSSNLIRTITRAIGSALLLELDKEEQEPQGDTVGAFTTRLDTQAELLKNNLAAFSEAEILYNEALKIAEVVYGRQSAVVARELNYLAGLLYSTDRRAEAEPLVAEALKISEAVYERQSAPIAACLNNLAGLLYSAGNFAEAEPLMWEALEISMAVNGKQSAPVAACQHNLAGLFHSTGLL